MAPDPVTEPVADIGFFDLAAHGGYGVVWTSVDTTAGRKSYTGWVLTTDIGVRWRHVRAWAGFTIAPGLYVVDPKWSPTLIGYPVSLEAQFGLDMRVSDSLSIGPEVAWAVTWPVLYGARATWAPELPIPDSIRPSLQLQVLFDFYGHVDTFVVFGIGFSFVPAEIWKDGARHE